MIFIKKYWWISIIVILLVVIFLQWQHYLKIQSANDQAFSQLRLDSTTLVKSRDKFRREVAEFKADLFTQRQLNLINDSTLIVMRKELKYWKNLVSHTSIASNTGDTLKIPIHDTIYKDKDSTYKTKAFTWNDQWLSLNGILLPKHIKIDYSFQNNLCVDYFWKRDHWYSKQYLAGSITQDNPHTTTGKVVQFTVSQADNKWYEKWWVHLLFGAGLGGTAMYFMLK